MTRYPWLSDEAAGAAGRMTIVDPPSPPDAPAASSEIQDATRPSPRCVECGKADAILLTEGELHPERGNRATRFYWRCSCSAYVGCHPGTQDPLGYPAGRATRAGRGYVHRVMDPLWRDAPAHYDYPGTKNVRHLQSLARTRVYEWLGFHMGLPPELTHTAMFDIDQCREAYKLLRATNYPAIRDWAKAHRAAMKKAAKAAKKGKPK